jgi:hypothetical protein
MNPGKILQPVILLSAIAVHCCLFQNSAMAAGTVSTCDEANLRAAVAGGGLVTFTCGSTIVLSNQIVITNNTLLDATGYGTTISGGNLVRIFSVNSGVTLELRHLTLADGFVVGPTNGDAMGGAILNSGGTIVLNDCNVLQNAVLGGPAVGGLFSGLDLAGNALGGAIWSSNGIVRATNTVFATNHATGGQGKNPGPVSSSASGGGFGGALFQFGGELSLVKCQFETNSGSSPDPAGVGPIGGGAVGGGAIWHSNSVATLMDCTFTGNSALGGNSSRNPAAGYGRGGAIFSGSQCTISNCSFLANNAFGGMGGNPTGPNGDGGALFLAAPAVISDSFFNGNSAQAGPGYTGGIGSFPGGLARGGAICNLNTLTLLRSTLALNEARGTVGYAPPPVPGTDALGGGLFNSGTVQGTNLTFYNNRSTGGAFPFTEISPSPSTAGGNAFGGGLCNFGGTVALSYATFSGNTAVGGAGNPLGATVGGGIQNTNGTVTLSGTIVANSPSGGNASGTLTDNGYNLSSDATCAFASVGSLNNTDPVLSPLGDFGGLTPTLALLAGSPAVNTGDPVNFPPTDQRGRTRPSGPAADIGAFESSAPYSVLGTISGVTTQDPVLVTAGSAAAPVTNYNYAIHGLGAGTYSVVPSNPNYLFVPVSQLATVGPDQVGINFKAYKWNAFTFADPTNGYLHAIYAASNSSVRIFNSPDLVHWSPFSTNAIGPEHYTELLIFITPDTSVYFHGISP